MKKRSVLRIKVSPSMKAYSSFAGCEEGEMKSIQTNANAEAGNEEFRINNNFLIQSPLFLKERPSIPESTEGRTSCLVTPKLSAPDIDISPKLSKGQIIQDGGRWAKGTPEKRPVSPQSEVNSEGMIANKKIPSLIETAELDKLPVYQTEPAKHSVEKKGILQSPLKSNRKKEKETQEFKEENELYRSSEAFDQVQESDRSNSRKRSEFLMENSFLKSSGGENEENGQINFNFTKSSQKDKQNDQLGRKTLEGSSKNPKSNESPLSCDPRNKETQFHAPQRTDEEKIHNEKIDFVSGVEENYDDDFDRINQMASSKKNKEYQSPFNSQKENDFSDKGSTSKPRNSSSFRVTPSKSIQGLQSQQHSPNFNRHSTIQAQQDSSNGIFGRNEAEKPFRGSKKPINEEEHHENPLNIPNQLSTFSKRTPKDKKRPPGIQTKNLILKKIQAVEEVRSCEGSFQKTMSP